MPAAWLQAYRQRLADGLVSTAALGALGVF